MDANLQPIVVQCQQLTFGKPAGILQLMVIKDEFSVRLDQLCDDMGIPPKGKNRQAIVGKQFGVSQEAARKWLEGESIPITTTIVSIAMWANVSTEWLLSGRGHKKLAVTGVPEMQEINKLMEPMTKARRYDVVRIVKALADEDKSEGQQ